MAKCYVEIGFATTKEQMTNETVPRGTGIWVEEFVRKNYYAELIRNTRTTGSDDKVNSDINLSNSFSILADPYLNENYFSIRYIKFKGHKWRVSDVEVQYPRLIINVGGIYNE